MNYILQPLSNCMSIRRWNDMLNIFDFNELDKQGHKLMVSLLLVHKIKDNVTNSDVYYIINKTMMDILFRSILKDIKSEIYNNIIKNHRKDLYNLLLHKYYVHYNGFINHIVSYDNFVQNNYDNNYKLDGLVKIVSNLINLYELHFFKNIYGSDIYNNEINNIIDNIKFQIFYDADTYNLRQLVLDNNIYNKIIEETFKLRNIKRWSSVQMSPSISVMGHSVIVMYLMYYYTFMKNKIFDVHDTYNIIRALFHDIGEAGTKDVVSPIKEAIPEIKNILNDYENKYIDNLIKDLNIVDFWKEIYFGFDSYPYDITRDEFKDDNFCSGSIIKVMDVFSALNEIYINNIINGNNNIYLKNSAINIHQKLRKIIQNLKNDNTINMNVDLEQILSDSTNIFNQIRRQK